MTFNPNKRTEIKQRAIERALFWYEVRLYLKVALIVSIPTALAIWMVMEWSNR